MCLCQAYTKKNHSLIVFVRIRVRRKGRERKREKRKVNVLPSLKKKFFYKRKECKPHFPNNDASETEMKRWLDEDISSQGKLSNSRSSHHLDCMLLLFLVSSLFLPLRIFFLLFSHIILIERIVFSLSLSFSQYLFYSFLSD